MSEFGSETMDWAMMAEVEEWQQKYDSTKPRKEDVRLDSLTVVSCSDDGTLHIWLPTLVWKQDKLLRFNHIAPQAAYPSSAVLCVTVRGRRSA